MIQKQAYKKLKVLKLKSRNNKEIKHYPIKIIDYFEIRLSFNSSFKKD